MKTSTQFIVIFAIGIAAFIAGNYTSKSPALGGYLTATVTSATSSVGTGVTTVLASSTNTQFLKITNSGNGIIFCAYGATTPATDVGERINPVGSSTLNQLVITDPNTLGKGVRCITTVTSTYGYVKY